MSFKAINWALEQQDVHGLYKFILVGLAIRDGHEEPHGCYPSIGRVAKDCGVARSTVKKALRALVAADKIRVEFRSTIAGDQDSNFYTFPHVWVGSNTAHLGRDVADGRSVHFSQVGRITAPNLKATVIEPKPGASAPVLESLRKIEARNRRIHREEAVGREVRVGAGPSSSECQPATCTACGAQGSVSWLRVHQRGIDAVVACPAGARKLAAVGGGK